ncbi:5-methyltetrahydropteroyltriglutamate--homocysteine methyltransferase, partial [Xanthomonas citri pv. citri]|nr:5-methyltetrahydropteroyltriglutamate--homocysteine methyltransferase [Xanthomonas citri pv. citri]
MSRKLFLIQRKSFFIFEWKEGKDNMSQQTTPAEQKSLQRKKPPFRADQVG